MNIIHSLMAERYNGLPPASIGRITEGSLLWLMNATNPRTNREFHRKDLSEVLREEIDDKLRVREFGNALTYQSRSGYLLRSVKPWLWWVVRNGLNRRQALKCARGFNVSGNDLELARHAMPNGVLRRGCRRLVAKYDALDYDEIGDLMEDSYANLRKNKYIEKFVSRKLTFIVKGDAQYGHNDLVSELVACSQRDVLMQYPKIESDLHFLNVIKGSIHNRGMNIILQHTRADSKGMKAADDGSFKLMTVSLSDVSLREPTMHVMDEVKLVPTLAQRIGGWQGEALHILSGQRHAAFTEWLNAKGLPDNQEFFLSMMARNKRTAFLRELAGYMDRPAAELIGFVDSLGRDMQEELE